MEWLYSKPIAHRGIHSGNEIPENSLASFDLAIEEGYAIEMDVSLSKDNQVIVFHDRNLFRLTGYRGSVRKEDYAKIKQLFLLETDYKIPLLSEALDFIRGRVPVLIEVKNDQRKKLFIRKLSEVVNPYEGDGAILSPNRKIIKLMGKYCPLIARGQLIGLPWQNFIPPKFWLDQGNLQFVAYNHHYIYAHLIQSCFTTKIPLIAWTIRNKKEMEKELVKADNIIFENFKPPQSLNSLAERNSLA